MARNGIAKWRPVDLMEYNRKQAAKKEQAVTWNNMQTTQHLRAHWENKTDDKLTSKRKTDGINQRRALHEQELNTRRRKLANLLQQEMEGWQKQISTASETPEDRKNKIKARAIELRDAREAERREFVDTCYTQQWRDSCDDARTLDSEALLTFIGEERQRQMALHADMKAEEKENEERFLVDWRKRIAEVERKEIEKEEFRRKMDHEVKGILDYQVGDIAKRKQQLKDNNAAEAKAELDEWQKAKDKEDREAIEKLKDAHARGHEIRTFNESRRHLSGLAAAEERRQDLLLLEYTMEKEKADEAAEANKKAEEIATTKRYQEFLKAQMIKEAEDNSVVDNMRSQYSEAIMKKRDDEMQRRDDARAYLMREVDLGRQKQIEEQMAQGKIDLEEDLLQIANDKAQQNELDRIEAEKVAMRKQARMDNVAGLRLQIGYREKQRMREEQEKYLSAKMMEKMERIHQTKLAAQGGVVRTYRPIKHTKWMS